MEVMDTVLEVIADNPPASNPEYIELPKSEKKIVKFAERSGLSLSIRLWF
jgi:hypothetical protein